MRRPRSSYLIDLVIMLSVIAFTLLCFALNNAARSDDAVFPLRARVGNSQLSGSATAIDRCQWDGTTGVVCVTAAHCVTHEGVPAPREAIGVEFAPGKWSSPRNVWIDSETDLAVVCCPWSGDVTCLELGPEPEASQSGESLGCDEGLIARRDDAEFLDIQPRSIWFRSRYLVTGGRSWGALLSRDGKCVGVVVSRQSHTAGGDPRIGHAVSVNRVREFVRLHYDLRESESTQWGCPGGFCPAPPVYQGQPAYRDPPSYQQAPPVNRAPPVRRSSPPVVQSREPQPCPCESRLGQIDQQIKGLKAEIAALDQRLKPVESAVTASDLERKAQQAMLDDLRADRQRDEAELQRLRTIKYPVRVLTPDGQVFSEEMITLGEPIEFRLVPKAKPAGE